MTKILSWKDKVNALTRKIKKLSDYYGGDDIEFLRDYCREVLQLYRTRLDEALDCFVELEKHIDYCNGAVIRGT